MHGSNQLTRPETDGLWAVTSYFNPVGYRRRLANYRLFRERLNLPLVTPELAYGLEFELNEQDADILVQLRSGDVLWQKERLLNVALSALPASCRKVVWLDCDILFANDRWAEEVSALLDRYPLVCGYARVHHLGPNWNNGAPNASEALFSQPSMISDILSGIPAAKCFERIAIRGPGTSANGFVWGARREFLDRHKFYDACIIGGGDTALTCAAYGLFDWVMDFHHMNDRQRERYLAWAKPVYSELRQDVACTDGEIFHLWHGDIQNRRPRERHRGLARFGFDPSQDIALADGRSWRWNTDKPEMHGYVRDYFAARREDG